MQNNLPIANLDAERAVLGACILSSTELGNVSEILKPEDFYDTNYQILYKILSEMYISGKPVDLVTISEELKNRKLFDRLGGQPLIAELMTNVTTTATASYYAGIVRDKALRRRHLEASEKISSLAYKSEIDTQKFIAEVERIIFDASQNKNVSSPVSIRELSGLVFHDIEDAYKSGGRKFSGYSSGFEDLDEIITGFQAGSLNIIAARPSMGKTALALNIAQFGGNEEKNPHILIFSLEMSAEQLVQRMLAAQSSVKVSAMTNGAMSEDDFYNLTEAAANLSQRNIYISDSSELSVMEFRSKCRRFKMRHPDLKLIIVDYLQLMRSEGRRTDNRQQETADISRMLKAVAIELECPVIALSQLSRETERRVQKKPQLSDLRDSGAIEQDADTVILLYREDYYDEDKLYTKQDSKAELRIAKNRNGRTGMCNLTFRREYTRFVGYAEEF